MFRKSKKGQAAMEFLMTYGWALLIVVIVGAVVFLVVRPSGLVGESKTGFSGVQVERFGVSAGTGGSGGTGSFQAILQNARSQEVNITNVYVAPATGGSGVATTIGSTLSPGETSSDFQTADIPSDIDSGDSFNYEVSVEYFFTDVGSGSDCSSRTCFNSTGTVSGSAS